MLRISLAAAALAAACAVPTTAPPQAPRAQLPSGTSAPACESDNGGLLLPDGFCALTVGSSLGPVRQIAVAANGDLYAAVAATGGSGGGGVIAFRDTTGDGRPDETATFGPGGGNDVKLHGDYLYFARNDRVLRWRLEAGKLAPTGDAETVVADLPADGGHVAKSIAFAGNVMYVNVGSRTNSCQEKDRVSGSRGTDPCTELERRAGIWTFAADRAGQTAADGRRYATGLRNAMALAVEPGSGVLYAGVHGRDQLAQNWGFSAEVNASDPAEILARVSGGEDFGWPYCYYSNVQRRLLLAPEYGGDGRRTDRCETQPAPAIAFPGHWAPMALAFYRSAAFGPRYANGAFMAWHGSWNRAPLPQEGYRVVFIPFRGGRPVGEYETFATAAEGPTSLRPAGVAVGPDGSLYISADRNAKIWRVLRRR